MSSRHSPAVATRDDSSTLTFVTIFVVAVFVNYPWELAQAPLYVGMTSFRIAWWHCFVASVGDGFLVLLIFVVGWVVLGRRNWFARPSVRGSVVMLATGLAIGVSVEWAAVHRLGRWAYTARMPLVPGLGVGMVPLLQMLVLPPLIFRVTALRRPHPSP